MTVVIKPKLKCERLPSSLKPFYIKNSLRYTLQYKSLTSKSAMAINVLEISRSKSTDRLKT